jgi:hypothetical protein
MFERTARAAPDCRTVPRLTTDARRSPLPDDSAFAGVPEPARPSISA